MLAQTFNDMAAQLNQAREAERNFLLSVSHELKTPLAAIRGYAEGLEEGVFTGDEAAATIREEARRLERLVRDLLDLARMNRREFVVHHDADRPRRGRARGRPSLRDGRAGRRRRARVRGRRRPRRRSPTWTACCRSCRTWSRTRSARHLPAARVHVRAEAGLLVVEDTGVGLAPEDVPHAFERFYLHDRNPDGRARIGSGLGLAIVKELTERMGGTVSVDSEVGRGTTFVVRLPVDTGSRTDELEPVASRPS